MTNKQKRKLAKRYAKTLKHVLQRKDTDISKLTTKDLKSWFVAFMEDIAHEN